MVGEEDLDLGHVDEGQPHELVADRLGSLLERGMLGNGREALGERDPDLRLALPLRLHLALVGAVAPDLHEADGPARLVPDRRDGQLDLEQAAIPPAVRDVPCPGLALQIRGVHGRLDLR